MAKAQRQRKRKRRATDLRMMKFLTVEPARLQSLASGEIHKAIILNLDNQADRPDDLIAIHLTEEDAIELFDQLEDALADLED